MTREIDYREVLQVCKQGRVPPELKELYKFPLRSEIPWSDFPSWARPDAETEGCHEG